MCCRLPAAEEDDMSTTLDPELFLPDPDPAVVRYTVISTDDHVVEPPHVFADYMQPTLRDRGPQLVETSKGHEVWRFEEQIYSQVGMNAVVGRRPDSYELEPFRFDQMRPGCYDVHARVRDMDLGGVWASLHFPSQITGFCGVVFANAEDKEVGHDAVRAWNDWIYTEWYQEYPDRIIPGGITYLGDSDQAVAEIRRNAERGFVSVTMPERPHLVGLPSLWERDFWDPIIQACVDTDTVISLHVGSSGMMGFAAGSPALQIGATLFGSLSLSAAVDWLWSEYPLRHPDLKIAMSEGGIGWVAMLLDRLDNLVDRSGYGRIWDERPADVLKRNFWFCTIDDPSTIDTRHRIGVENITVETDYPHGDGTWPGTQEMITELWGHLPANELRMICSENAAALYRHPLPKVVLPADA
jgi:predicted TIM-barrel fold metal-dependent hydrolase